MGLTGRLTISHAGKYGDLIWSLPAVRAAARALGNPVRLWLPESLGSIAPLLRRQDYIADVILDPEWKILDTAPVTPWLPPVVSGSAGESVIHLGHREWPTDILPRYSMSLLQQQWREAWGPVPGLELCLEEPWITASCRLARCNIIAAYSDEWIELKYGVTAAVAAELGKEIAILRAIGSRWDEFPEIEGCVTFRERNWLDAADELASRELALGSLSALSVLAAAVGTPRVLFEPNEHAHHPIFQHWDTPLVKGSDGLPTFDSRHVADAMKAKLKELK